MSPFPQPKIAATGLILAGGEGKRLSPDKPLLTIDQLPMIEHTAKVVSALFDEVLLVTNTPGKYTFLGLPTVSDEMPGCGPLMGIYSGLKKMRHPIAFVCAADMPFLDPTIIARLFQEMGAHDIVVPCPDRRPEFLHAFYDRRCMAAMRKNLKARLFKLEMLEAHCKTRRLVRAWFDEQGLSGRIQRAFANVNTLDDYHRWALGAVDEQPRKAGKIQYDDSESDDLKAISPSILAKIRQTLIDQESAFQQSTGSGRSSSTWAHSLRVAGIARHIACAEGWPEEPAMLAGLLHDIGKFAHGRYHTDETPEEENAVKITGRILANSPYTAWLGTIEEAILSAYMEGQATNDIGRAVYDADCLDKLGSMGVAQFFVKRALREQFLDNDLLIRASIELTYARHAPRTLTTATGRALAAKRQARTRQFYKNLLEEWGEFGLGPLTMYEEEIAGIACTLVVPDACGCGRPLTIQSDINDAVKCRSAVVTYRCDQCGFASAYSFCLPNVAGLPRKQPP